MLGLTRRELETILQGTAPALDPICEGMGNNRRYVWNIVAPPGNHAETEKTISADSSGKPQSTRQNM